MSDKKDISDGYHTFGELYAHRYALFLNLLVLNPETAWRSKLHHDGSMFDDSFIAGMTTTSGQVTYHIPLYLWGMFEGLTTLDHAPEWDGHNSNDVVIRLQQHAREQLK